MNCSIGPDNLERNQCLVLFDLVTGIALCNWTYTWEIRNPSLNYNQLSMFEIEQLCQICKLVVCELVQLHELDVLEIGMLIMSSRLNCSQNTSFWKKLVLEEILWGVNKRYFPFSKKLPYLSVDSSVNSETSFQPLDESAKITEYVLQYVKFEFWQHREHKSRLHFDSGVNT